MEEKFPVKRAEETRVHRWGREDVWKLQRVEQLPCMAIHVVGLGEKL